MNVPLRVVERPGLLKEDSEVGDMWLCGWPVHQIEGRPPCWVVRMPRVLGYIWHTNDEATNGTGFWQVTGEAPKLTITPSIHIYDRWHGWIRDGELVSA